MSTLCVYFGLLSISYAYENIALNKPAYQQHQYMGLEQSLTEASNAVDGLKSNMSVWSGQCVTSEVNQQTATWWVNLTEILSIHSISIYYRTENVDWGASNGFASRFVGFSLYVSNTTELHDGVLCFKDTSFTTSTIPAVFNTMCNVYGQYVIYYNERLSGKNYPSDYSKYAFNEICELEVYGCPTSGFYGSECSLPCPDTHCRYCHIETGTCQGCKAGYQGHTCELECPYGLFGQDCANNCSSTCTGCNNVNGSCDKGCHPGWKGDYCEEPCGDRTFGQNCSEQCGKCLNFSFCHHINGTCMNGCDRGYQGLTCKEACPNGFFGANCRKRCNSTCTGCDAENGLCSKGCHPGWKGDYCQNLCENGTFGKDCSEQCGNCVQFGQCHHINGTCLQGCAGGFQGMTCSKPITAEPLGNVAAIVGAAVGILGSCALIIAVILKIRRMRRKQPKQDRYISTHQETENQYSNVNLSTSSSYNKEVIDRKSRPMFSPSSLEGNNEDSSYEAMEESNVYMNETPTHDILVGELQSAILEKGAKENDEFKKEYAALPSGELHQCDVGKRPENISKNRFKTTFPYDHSRVVLKATSGDNSDYINANFIDGTNKLKEYIAAQGPKQNTVDDFWRMIWQEDITSIVMLTNLKEGDKFKCYQYWPKVNESLSFGPLTVKMIEEKEYAFFVIRKLSVTKSSIKKTRVVTQYHYTAWPDHGTPEPLSLLDFHHHVISTCTSEIVPTVVHCSAGVGRTGTYIALDVLYQGGRKTGKVNVVGFVKKMRQNRVSMVQTYEQYITIYLALNEIFKAPLKRSSATEFCSKIERTMRDTPANRNPLRNEFQLLMKVRPSYTEIDYKIARQTSTGRRTDKVLPLDKYSLHLSSMVPKRGSYINAIYMPSFTKGRRFIVTHYPTPEDAVDFLRLLNDHESDIVICLDPVHDVKSIKCWLPELSSSRVVSPFTIHCPSKSRNGKGQMIEILHNEQEDESHSVLVEGPRSNLNPGSNNQDTSELLSLVTDALASKTENPITVVSSDGASLCGMFIAVHNVIQQLNMDGGVDVFTAVRQLQVRRPELCNNMEEYEMIHRSVYDHIQTNSENIYCNQ